LGFRVAATNLPQHHIPIPIVDHNQPERPLEPVVIETEEVATVQTEIAPATDAPALPITAATDDVAVPESYVVDLRSGLGVEPTAEAVETVEAVPATVVVAAKEEEVAVPAQQVVQVANTNAIPYAHYLVPGYTANYAPAYQPYAANYGYYYNPSYVTASGAPTHTQYHAQDELGQYNYGYATADSAKSEVKTADGIVQGTYSYVDANGILQTTNYVSDAWGFRVAATNLPVAVTAVEEKA
jgi:hypothetical protein